MNHKEIREPFCFLCSGPTEQSPRQEAPKNNYVPVRHSKTSLKRASSRPSLAETPFRSQLEPTPRYMQPSSCTDRVSIEIRTPLTPKPPIRFSWNADLEQTKKIEEQKKEDAGYEEQLQKTKPMYKKLTNLSSLANLTKASLISVPDNSSPKIPKVEQSLIMVDYFHPNSQQMLNLERLVQSKVSP